MKKTLFILMMLMLMLPSVVRADGAMISPEPYYMYESEQRAVILYDDDTQTETMVLSVKFQGNAEDFAWIIPVPSEPTISKGSDELFTSIAELTNSSYYYYPYEDTRMEYVGDYAEAVEVISVKQVDYYDITTLASTDSRALVSWLNRNGYDYPSGAEYVFNSYIENDWYFVAIKIDSSAAELDDVATDLREGHATPLKLSFQTKNLVYPMKISSVINEATTTTTEEDTEDTLADVEASAKLEMEDVYYPSYSYTPDYVNIELYILADHKKMLPDFYTSYGNWVKKDKIEQWAVDDQGDPLLQPTQKKYFLTKLTNSMTYSDMDEDLFPRDADDNKKVNAQSGLTNGITATLLFLLAMSIFSVFVFTIGTFSPFGISFIIFTIIQNKTQSKGWRISSWIIQIFVTTVFFLTGLAVLLAMAVNRSSFIDIPSGILSSSLYYSSSTSDVSFLWMLTILIPVVAFLAIPIYIMVKQARRRRKSK